VVILEYSVGVCWKGRVVDGEGRAASKPCSNAWEEVVSNIGFLRRSGSCLVMGQGPVETLGDWRLDGTTKE